MKGKKSTKILEKKKKVEDLSKDFKGRKVSVTH